MSAEEEQDGGGSSLRVVESALDVDRSTLDVDSSDVDMDDEMEMSSGMLSFASPTKRDSLDEGYDPNETIKVIVYEGNTIEIRPSTLGIEDDDDEGGTTDDDVTRATTSNVEPDDILSTDVQFSTGQATGAEEEESEELGSQDTYFYPSKFGLCRDYEVDEDESEKPIAIKPISIKDPVRSPRKKVKIPMAIPGPPSYLTRSQISDIPKIEVTTDDEGETEPKKIRRGSQNKVSFPIPEPVQYLSRKEKSGLVKVDIHPEPEDAEILPEEIQLEKSDTVDSTQNGSSRPGRQARVTFNIPEPVQYLEREGVRDKRVQSKPDAILDGDLSDQDDLSVAKTSDSEVEAVQLAATTERKRYRPVTARVRVTSPLPEPVNYLSRRESQRSSICDTSQAEDLILPAIEADLEIPVAKTSDSISFVAFKEPYQIPEPVTYLTRQEKLDRLRQVACTGSVDSDTAVFNEIMRAVQASAASIDSDEVYEEIMKAFKGPNRSFDSYDIYNEIMSALRSDEREDTLRLTKQDSLDIAAPEILSFHNFTQSSTYSSVKTPSQDEQIVDIDVIDTKEESPTKSAESPTTNESIDIPENPVSSPVHYPSSKLNFDESYTPVMIDGKVRKVSAKSLSKLRQHCSSRAHPCDCNDVRKNIFSYSSLIRPTYQIRTTIYVTDAIGTGPLACLCLSSV